MANMEDRKVNQQLFAEQMWKALLGKLYEGKIVSTFIRKRNFSSLVVF